MGIKQAGPLWGRKPLSPSNSERPVGDGEKGLGQRAAGRVQWTPGKRKPAGAEGSAAPSLPTPPLQAVATLYKPGRCQGHTAALWHEQWCPAPGRAAACSSPLALRSMERCKRPRCDANYSNFLCCWFRSDYGGMKWKLK